MNSQEPNFGWVQGGRIQLDLLVAPRDCAKDMEIPERKIIGSRERANYSAFCFVLLVWLKVGLPSQE